MRKLNLLNQIYMLILVALIIAAAVKLWKYDSGSRFYYSGSFTAPRFYPIRIQQASFIIPNGERSASLSDSEVNDDRGSEWGHGDFEQTHNRLQLPTKLALRYVSYRDQKYYADTLNLPVQLMDSIFRNGEKNGTITRIYRPGEDVYGFNFLIGVANNGNIIVWLQGNNYETVLLKHRIVDKEPLDDDLYYGKKMNKKEYLKERFRNLADDIIEDIEKGADLHANYVDSSSKYIRKPR